MPLIRFPGLAVLLLLISSCALEPKPNQYQLPVRPNQPGQGAVAELQRSASEALQRDAYQQAIDYLQRAIKIDPRNPHSWHYLAEVYWRSGDLRRCVEMVERSFSYSDSDDRLDRVNRQLRQKCQQG
ncbi:MAG: tetratricopeptide repeat protein [Gammaproteobacteria bacterium]|nr:tetratricopeptide repeat protein [Gammaproteobacteria bacterium]